MYVLYAPSDAVFSSDSGRSLSDWVRSSSPFLHLCRELAALMRLKRSIRFSLASTFVFSSMLRRIGSWSATSESSVRPGLSLQSSGIRSTALSVASTQCTIRSSSHRGAAKLSILALTLLTFDFANGFRSTEVKTKMGMEKVRGTTTLQQL